MADATPADPDAHALANTLFPPPPAYYQHYTEANLARYAELGEASGTNKGKGASSEEEAELAALRVQLDKPRVDWVENDGRWLCFGEQYETKPTIPTPSQLALPPLFPPGPSGAGPDAHDALPRLLHSFMHTLLLLVDTLASPAPDPGQVEESGFDYAGDQYVRHMTDLSATMMVMSNQLRGVQAEETLVLLMEKQLAERRAQTTALKSKCERIAGTLRALREA